MAPAWEENDILSARPNLGRFRETTVTPGSPFSQHSGSRAVEERPKDANYRSDGRRCSQKAVFSVWSRGPKSCSATALPSYLGSVPQSRRAGCPHKLLGRSRRVFPWTNTCKEAEEMGLEQGGTPRMRVGEKRNRRTARCHLCLVMSSKSPPCCAVHGSTWLRISWPESPRRWGSLSHPHPSCLLNPFLLQAHSLIHPYTRTISGHLPVQLCTHPLEHFALQEGLDHIVGGGEIPGLVDEVDGFEPSWEGILQGQTAPPPHSPMTSKVPTHFPTTLPPPHDTGQKDAPEAAQPSSC